MIKNKNILYGIGLGQDNDNIIKYMKKNYNEINKNKNNNYIYGNVNYNNNYLDSFDNKNIISNNCNIKNYCMFSNDKYINCNFINLNYFGFNFFNSNLFYYDSIRNVLKRY